MALQNQEIRTESISESTGGRAIIIDADYTTVADVDHLHIMTVADVLDSVYLEAFNSYSTTVGSPGTAVQAHSGQRLHAGRVCRHG